MLLNPAAVFRGKGWDPVVPNSSAVAAVSWGENRLDVFGIGSDYAMYHNYWTPTNDWSSWVSLGGSFGGSFGSPPVALASTWGGQNRLDVFAIDADGLVRHNFWPDPEVVPGGGWLDSWESVPLGGSGPPPYSPLGAVSWGQNRLDLFAVTTIEAPVPEANTNPMLHNYWTPSTGWQSTWANLGGVFVSGPAAVSWGENRLDVFAASAVYPPPPFHGGQPASSMSHNFWTPTSGGWLLPAADLGGTFSTWPGGLATPPAALASTWGGQDRLDVFAVDDTGAARHKFWPAAGGGWLDSWAYVPSEGSGSFAGPMAAVSWGENRLDVFAASSVADSWPSGASVYYNFWTPSTGWQPSWADLNDGVFACYTAPAAVTWGENRLDVFALGSDYAMWQNFWTPTTGWQPNWINLGGPSGNFIIPEGTLTPAPPPPTRL